MAAKPAPAPTPPPPPRPMTRFERLVLDVIGVSTFVFAFALPACIYADRRIATGTSPALAACLVILVGALGGVLGWPINRRLARNER